MIKEFIQKIPKAELLIHIEGSLEPELMLTLAQRNNIKLPYATPEEIRQAYQFKDLAAFHSIYNAGLRVLVTEQDFYDLTIAYLEKAASQNIRHTEISFDPQAHIERGVELQTVVTGMHRAAVDAEKQFKISTHLILCFMRELSVDDAQQILQKAMEFKDWIVAICACA
jgi:adenosine deaminase